MFVSAVLQPSHRVQIVPQRIMGIRVVGIELNCASELSFRARPIPIVKEFDTPESQVGALRSASVVLTNRIRPHAEIY